MITRIDTGTPPSMIWEANSSLSRPQCQWFYGRLLILFLFLHLPRRRFMLIFITLWLTVSSLPHELQILLRLREVRELRNKVKFKQKLKTTRRQNPTGSYLDLSTVNSLPLIKKKKNSSVWRKILLITSKLLQSARGSSDKGIHLGETQAVLPLGKLFWFTQIKFTWILDLRAFSSQESQIVRPRGDKWIILLRNMDIGTPGDME